MYSRSTKRCHNTSLCTSNDELGVHLNPFFNIESLNSHLIITIGLL